MDTITELAEDLFNTEDIKKIIEMYESGCCIDDIMEFFHSEEHNIRVVLKEYQIDRQYNTFKPEIYQRLIKKYQDGLSQFKISYDLSISEGCVRRVLRKNNIKKRSYSENNRRYNRNSHYFDKIDTQNKAYILGLLFADGNNFPPHNSVSISLQEEDRYVLDFIKNELEYEGPVRLIPLHDKNPNHKNQYVLCINDAYLSKHLEKYGIVQAKSLAVKFPDFIRMKYLNHFIRGYFDGDGCISYSESKRKPRVCITGTYEFVTKIAEIINSMNGKCSISHPSQSKNSNTYNLFIQGYNAVNNFMEWLYDGADFKMKRKYEKYLQIKELFKTNVNPLIA